MKNFTALRAPAAAFSALVLSVAIASCSNSSGTGVTGASGAGTAPGVTPTSITVGSLATLSGTFATTFGDIVYGVKAYFDMVNAQGGVDGRKIYLKYVDDDQGSPTVDEDESRNLVDQDHVFAIVGVGSPFFSAGPFLARNDTPTFGYVVIDNWRNYPNLFGAYGDLLNYTTGEGGGAWLAKQFQTKSAAVIAYGIAASSKDACAAYADGLTRFGVHVGFEDLNLGYLADPTPDVQQMVAAHSDFLVTCVDGPENLKIVDAIHQYGLDKLHMVWLNGYDRTTIALNASVMTGSIFLVQHVPFEVAQQFPGKYPAMDQYVSTMQRYEPNYVYDDLAMQGWIDATQFVTGLRAVGRDLTQQKLIDAINAEKGFNGGGLKPPINPSWQAAHTTTAPPYCASYVEVMPGGKLQVILVHNGDEVYTCFNGKTDVPIEPEPADVPPG